MPYRRMTALMLVAALHSLGIATLFTATPARAASIVVTTTADETGTGAACSLREAITAANTDAAYGGCAAGSGADTITFDAGVTGTITLTSGQIQITSSVTITGPGAATLTVSGNNTSRIFEVTAGDTVEINGLTIANGNASNGGGILNSGTLTVTNTTLSSNTADFGSGGGILNNNSGTLTVNSSTLSGNTADFGGVIYNDSGTLRVNSSTFSGNTAISSLFGGFGGGIFTTGGTLRVNSSTFSSNTADFGGVIYITGGTLTVTNSTLSGNSAASNGGGIYISGGTLTVTNSTLSGNSAGNSGGIYTVSATTITNSIVAGNISTASMDDNITGTVTLLGVNITSGDPGLLALANNGGSTQTMALMAGSPALNAGDNTVLSEATSGIDYNGDGDTADTLDTDQRGAGFPRIVGGTVDIGAVESVQTVSIAAQDAAAAEAGTDAGTFRISRTGNTVGALDVSYTVGGTATNGTDYTPNLTGTVSIPDGAAFVDITITPVDDATIEGSETGILTLTDGALYDLDANTSATVTIADNDTASLNLIVDRIDDDTSAAATACTTLANDCTLRGAINTAQGASFPGADTITFDATVFATPQTINITATGADLNLPTITTPLTIDGPDSARVTVNAGNVNGRRVFTVNAAGQAVEFRDLTVTGGLCNNGGGCPISFTTAGGLYINAGTVTVASSTVTSNSSYQYGGGIGFGEYAGSFTGTLNVINSTISGNTTGGSLGGQGLGGGIFAASGTALTVTDSTITGNSADPIGGGIYSGSDMLTITNSTISENDARGGAGLYKLGGTTTITASTISDNTTDPGSANQGEGGGITINAAIMTIINSTISGNSISNANVAYGGGIMSFGSLLTIVNSTISDNSATASTSAVGGGVLSVNFGTTTLQNTIIAGNTASTDADCSVLVNATVTANANNLLGASCNPTGTDILATPANLLLSGLTNNGGSTLTMLPQAGSAAIGSGDPTICQNAQVSNVDQRGVTRLSGADISCNIGSVETPIPIVTISANDPNAAEAGQDPGSFTITRTGSTASALNVTISIGGTAINGTDYTPTLPTTITIPAGAAFVEVQIIPVDDVLIEGSETAILMLTDATAYDLGANTSATVTIADNDTTPIVSITANDPDAAETASDPGSFTITRTGNTTNPLDVIITITGSATNGTDYTPTLPTTITIPAGSAFVEIQIDPVDDALVEGSETAILTLFDVPAYDLGANTSATVTIADNDTTPVVSITANDPDAAETANDPGRFIITRTGNTTNPLDVTITITGTATGGTDYTPTLTTPVTIPAGSTFVEIGIDPVDDADVEGAETAILTVVDTAAYDLGANTSATVTIADNDVPTVTISPKGPPAAEAGIVGTFTITRTGSTTGILNVSYTISGTATGADYNPTLTGTVTIPDGFASIDLIFAPVDDAVVEGTETVILTLASGAGYTVGTPDAATITITDNDVAPLPALSINDVTLGEGSSGTTSFTFTVLLSSPAGAGGVTFDIATADGTATVTDGDYTANSLTGQSIAAGSSNYTFTVLVTGDVKIESTETFFVNVTNIVGATVTDGQGQGTITNDDSAGVTVSETGGTTITTEAGGTDTINVVLSAQPTSDVVISVTSGNTLEVTVNVAQLTFTTSNWNQIQSVTVTGIDDAAVDGDQSVTVTFSVDDAASNDAFDTVADELVSVTNTDNDVLPTIDIAAPDAAAAEAGTDAGTFTITRTGGTTAALNVSYSIGGTAATDGTDYTPTLTGTATIAIGQSSVNITVTPVDDPTTEGDETITLTLVAQPSYTLGANTAATVIITDNDAPAGLPTVTISASDATAAEAGADTGTFLVTRSGATTGALTVNYTVAGTATVGTDYTPNLTGTVDIPIGQASAAITITPVNDTAVEGNEAVLLTLGASADYTVGTPNNATVIIVDDDGTSTGHTSSATAVPAPPLCSLIGGGTNRIIRADVPGGLNADVFCRIIVENTVYVQRAAEVGDGMLVNAGIIQAVDVFGFTANGVQVADFNLPITVCLQGSGRMFYRDATDAPRITVPLAVTTNNGYTCASIPNAGTVILLP